MKESCQRNDDRFLPLVQQDGERKLTGQRPLHSQCDGKHRHQRLVSERVDDGADHGTQVPLARDPAVQQVRDAGVREKAQCPAVVTMQDAVADEGRGNQPRDSQQVGDGVDILVRGG